MAAKNRAFFCLNAISANLRQARIDPIERARVDTTLSVLGDLTGACGMLEHAPRACTHVCISHVYGMWCSAT